MNTLCATPYNLDASFFYFNDIDDYEAKARCHLDRYGNLVDEYEIQFVDGADAALFEACGINQANLSTWFNEIELLQDHDKVSLYYLAVVAGYSLEQALDKLEEPSIAASNLRDSAVELFDECWLHEVPEKAHFYIDYDRFARDCSLCGDMVEFEYQGKTYTCVNANGI